jgi:hypothetical protein
MAKTYELESDQMNFHPLVSWRSVLAGLLVGLLTLAIFLSLGAAFGGIGLSGEETSAANAGIFTGVWFLVSTVIALFVGGYFAARVSKFQSGRIGSAQGLVIASVFFGLFLWQAFATLGWAGRMTGQAVSGATMAAGAGISQAADSPVVKEAIENQIGDLNLKSEPSTVIGGIASRLVRGDSEGAKTYLASQAGITEAQADARIAQLRAQVETAMIEAREGAGRALQATGWSLFATLLLGSAAAIGGGALGSRANVRKPLVREHEGTIREFGPAHV